MTEIEINLRNTSLLCHVIKKKPLEGSKHNLVGDARKVAAMPFPPLPIAVSMELTYPIFPIRGLVNGSFLSCFHPSVVGL